MTKEYLWLILNNNNKIIKTPISSKPMSFRLLETIQFLSDRDSEFGVR